MPGSTGGSESPPEMSLPEGPAWLVAIALGAGVLTVGAKAVVTIVTTLTDRKHQPTNGWKDRMATAEREIERLREWRHDEVAQQLTALRFEAEVAKEDITELKRILRTMEGRP